MASKKTKKQAKRPSRSAAKSTKRRTNASLAAAWGKFEKSRGTVFVEHKISTDKGVCFEVASPVRRHLESHDAYMKRSRQFALRVAKTALDGYVDQKAKHEKNGAVPIQDRVTWIVTTTIKHITSMVYVRKDKRRKK